MAIAIPCANVDHLSTSDIFRRKVPPSLPSFSKQFVLHDVLPSPDHNTQSLHPIALIGLHCHPKIDDAIISSLVYYQSPSSPRFEPIAYLYQAIRS